MGSKRRCPGCKIHLTNHSFGLPSKHCDGPNAAVAEADEMDVAAVSEAALEVNSVNGINKDPHSPARMLSPSVEAQWEQNKKLRDELALLQQEEDL